MDEEVKICNSCNLEKPIYNFHRSGKKRRQASCSTCRNERRKSWDKSSSKKANYIFYEYKRSALKRNIDFLIAYNDFINFENSDCHYCGIELDQIRLDRIDNDKGYFLANIVPCCRTCNFLKHTLGREEFLAHIFKIYIHQKEKHNGKQKRFIKKIS